MAASGFHDESPQDSADVSSSPAGMGQPLTPWISQGDIASAVSRLARELDQLDWAPGLVLVGVLTGSFVFLADLVRQLQTPIHRIDFIKTESYGAGQNSSGAVNILYGPAAEAVRGHPVVVVEDIIDTGITTAAVLEHLERLEPSSLEVCALLDKPSRRRVDARARFVGITIPDRFVVGYGMDLDQRYRQLPGIHYIAATQEDEGQAGG